MGKSVKLDAKCVYYKQYNESIRVAVRDGATELILENVNGQRYIGNGLDREVVFHVHGVPGEDMASFMRGPKIYVHGNAQNGTGNTMDAGKVVIEGLAGDVTGYAMRGGSIYVKGDVGYRNGIHMKAYMEQIPVLVIGGKAGDFLGEYMAGGIILLLGMFSDKPDAPISGRSLGTGMHGGVIYVRGEVPGQQLGPGLHAQPTNAEDLEKIREIVEDYAKELDLDPEKILDDSFVKIRPFSHRPYGNMYVPT